MNKLLDFIENHKYGILVTLVLHIGVFVFFQLVTYQEIILYEPWDFRSMYDEAPDDIEIHPDQIQTSEEYNLMNLNEKVTSFVKNEDESREKSNDEKTRFTSYSKGGNAEQIEDEYERQMKEELMQKHENRTSDIETEKEEPTDKNKRQGSKASEKAVGGETMVSYSLSNRFPLHHNDWHIRNPGYTCGDVDGIVKVAISVGEGGEVLTATILDAESVNASSCMRQKAREYALLSRFNYDANAPKKQEGTITYRFVYRE